VCFFGSLASNLLRLVILLVVSGDGSVRHVRGCFNI
jgi:hypothetical protein